MKEEDKKEGLLKRLKDIEDKNEKQLKIIRNKTDIKSQIDFFDKYLTPEAVALIKEVKSMGDNIDYDKLFFTGGSKKFFCGFKNFKTLEKLIKDLHNRNITIDETEMKQDEFKSLINQAKKFDKLKAYPARGSKYIDLKEIVSKTPKNFMTDGRKLFMCLKREYYHFLKRII